MEIAERTGENLTKVKAGLLSLKTKSRVHVAHWRQLIDGSKAWHGVYHLGRGKDAPRPKTPRVPSPRRVAGVPENSWEGVNFVFNAGAAPVIPKSVYQLGSGRVYMFE